MIMESSSSLSPRSLRFISHQSFFTAVRSNDLESVKLMVNDGEGSDTAAISGLMAMQNDGGATALYVAAENNFQEVFDYLIRFCDLETVKIRNKADSDVFSVAAQHGYLGIVNKLLGLWPELCKVCDVKNTSPLYLAAVKDHLEVVNAILDADVTCIRIVRKNGKTALHTAARYGKINMVKTLIERDSGIVPIKDKKGQTALHMAVKGQSTAVVEELLLAGHSILNERDKKGNTAIHIATRKSRSPIVSMLLSFNTISVNVINLQQETAMDIADKLSYGPPKLAIMEALTEAGAKLARHVGRIDEEMQLKRTVSDIKHDVHSQLLQNEKTQRRVSGIAKELKKIHREAVQNTINSLTVVAVLFASIAFLAIFNLPGQYQDSGKQAGEADIARTTAFRAFCLFNATSLFISLAVVVVQITLVAWDTRAQRQIVSVVNKLMWAAGISTCGAFCSIAFVVVGKKDSWMAITMTVVGVVTVVGTLASLCYTIFQQRYGNNDSQRRIKRASGSKSFSWSYSVNISDDESDHDHEKIYAL
ncbi:putative ankyrin repeat-containing domain, PGG domain, ankyrin repeat-containing domain superfamily [Helianthus annuus]|nr:putative ankyrin repeat-containing domain, PGG domain, ankyrin repeat-containing domain superfamily [Helianthus annuus]KAJ0865803.1 putative ankyrin repeat-containing domain, PGG domain, ankyrin repeat-containing domain superfamily [Helianthus annuus]